MGTFASLILLVKSGSLSFLNGLFKSFCTLLKLAYFCISFLFCLSRVSLIAWMRSCVISGAIGATLVSTLWWQYTESILSFRCFLLTLIFLFSPVKRWLSNLLELRLPLCFDSRVGSFKLIGFLMLGWMLPDLLVELSIRGFSIV